MKIRFLATAFFCVATIGLQSEESGRNHDLKIILEKTYLHPQMEPLLNMKVMEAASQSEKHLDAEEAIAKFRDSFGEEAIQAKFRAPYSVFTDEDILALRKIFENPAYEKYTQHGGQTFMQNMDVLTGLFKAIIDQNGTETPAEKLASEILEITQSNHQKEIAESTKPLIVDVYSSACPPCRMMEPIFEEMSREYKDSIRFAKINCDTESELAKKYGVKALPTLLFIKPGKGHEVMKTSGFTPKKEFQAKIGEFLKSQEATLKETDSR